MEFQVQEVIDCNEWTPTGGKPSIGWKLRCLQDGQPTVIRITSLVSGKRYAPGDTFTGSVTGTSKDGLPKVRRENPRPGANQPTSQPPNTPAKAPGSPNTPVSSPASTKGPIPYTHALAAFLRIGKDLGVSPQPEWVTSLFIAMNRGEVSWPPDTDRIPPQSVTQPARIPAQSAREPGDDWPDDSDQPF